MRPSEFYGRSILIQQYAGATTAKSPGLSCFAVNQDSAFNFQGGLLLVNVWLTGQANVNVRTARLQLLHAL